MKLFFIIIVFLLNVQCSYFYNTNICISDSFDFIEVDPVGNIYFVKNDQLKKYNSKGQLLKIYSNKKLGTIFSIDVSNPLKVLLFYKDQSQIIILDSQLSQNAESIDLIKYNLEQTDLACNSLNNGFWLFDRQNIELLRLDASLNKILNTGNLNVLLSKNINPNYIIEKENYLFLNNPEDGILMFDIYGTYYKTIPVSGLKHFQVKDGCIFYYKDKIVHKYDFSKLITDELGIKNSTTKDVYKIENGLLEVFKDSVCATYN